MSQEKRIVVVGSHVQGLFMRVERFPTADETILGWDFREALDGGKGSHQAIACARLGVSTSFVGRVGKDRLGDRGAGWMRDAGVDLTHLKRSEGTATGVGFVMIAPNGVAAITTAMGANEELSEADIDEAEETISRSSTMLVTFEIPVSTALYATRIGRRHGLTVILTPGPAEPLAPDALSGVDIPVPNESEAKVILGMDATAQVPVDQLARRCQERYGLKRIIITMGERGAAVADDDAFYRVPAIPVQVVDTPGASDAFTAGLAVALLRGAPLAEAVRFGCITGAYAVTIRESVPAFPNTEQLSGFIAEHGLSVPPGIIR